MLTKVVFIFNIHNISWAPNQHIRMISEGLFDTEDWSNDAENSALPHGNKSIWFSPIEHKNILNLNDSKLLTGNVNH